MPKVIGPATITPGAGPSLLQRKLKFASKSQAPGMPITAAAAAAAKERERKKKAAEDAAAKSSMVFNKGHGQHILKNPLVINAIVEKSGIKSTDVVVEIGPGTGNLTERLLMVAKKVIAFEIDPRMVAELHKRFQSSPYRSKLEVIRGNCLDFDFPPFDRCVANVPYAISSALVFKLLKRPDFKCAVLMFQREFAMRVCAPPGSEIYCRLSVNSQLLARCAHLIKVSKNSFSPPPKVESSVIRLDPRHPPPKVDFEEWDGLVKLLFNRKNKKVSAIFRTKAAVSDLYDVHASYARMGKLDKLELDAFKEKVAGLLSHPYMERRSRSLEIEDVLVLLNHFNDAGVHFA
jgi:18S rRNA (adenine1779-N6/adenine1780-N6)-dimethyltransferase